MLYTCRSKVLLVVIFTLECRPRLHISQIFIISVLHDSRNGSKLNLLVAILSTECDLEVKVIDIAFSRHLS